VVAVLDDQRDVVEMRDAHVRPPEVVHGAVGHVPREAHRLVEVLEGEVPNQPAAAYLPVLVHLLRQ
jgi:hypothetical protein